MRFLPLASLRDVPSHDDLAVLINVDTPRVAALAIASAARYLHLPMLVVECSRDGGEVDLEPISMDEPCYLLRAPLKPHGRTLDDLFAGANARTLWLVDSDVVFLSSTMAEAMRALLADPAHYGAGMVHRGDWMTGHGVPYGWYVERPWIPFCALRVAPVRRGLAAGVSFMNAEEPNEFTRWPGIAATLMRRWRTPFWRRFAFDFLAPWRNERFGVRPAFFYLDTGAAMHQHLLAHGGGTLGPVDPGIVPGSVRHYHGVTRRRHLWWDSTGTGQDEIAGEVESRLRSDYGIGPAQARG